MQHFLLGPGAEQKDTPFQVDVKRRVPQISADPLSLCSPPSAPSPDDDLRYYFPSDILLFCSRKAVILAMVLSGLHRLTWKSWSHLPNDNKILPFFARGGLESLDAVNYSVRRVFVIAFPYASNKKQRCKRFRFGFSAPVLLTTPFFIWKRGHFLPQQFRK